MQQQVFSSYLPSKNKGFPKGNKSLYITDRYNELYSSYVLLMTLPKNLLYLLPQSLLLYYVIKGVLPVLERFKLIEKDMLITKFDK